MFQYLKNWWKALKNIFHNLLVVFVGSEKYPKIILPKPTYAQTIDINKLLGLKLHLVRRLDVDCKEAYNEVGILLTDFIEPKGVPGLSLNLLGGFFKIKHIKFRIFGKASEPWTKGTQIKVSDFENEFKVLKSVCPAIYALEEIHQATIPFVYSNKSASHKQILKSLKLNPRPEDEYTNLQGKIQVIHSPTNLNYWHVQLDLVHPLKGSLIRIKNQVEQDAAAHFIRDILAVPIDAHVESRLLINRKFYTA